VIPTRCTILNNVPDPDPGDPGTFSQPGAELWTKTFDASQFTTVSPYGSGDITGEPPAVPALSAVGLVFLALALLVGLTIVMLRLREVRP
jgi:hypothetical protein